LADLQQQLETTQADIMQWQQSLRVAMINSLSEADVAGIAAKQIQLAKEGKESAIAFVMKHLLGSGAPVSITTNNIITDVEGAARLANK
jgi:hypothetical protein